MQKLREILVLVLIGLLPLHAFLVTILTRVIAGPRNSPLSHLVIWKELLFLFILGIAGLEILGKRKTENGKLPADRSLGVGWKADKIDLLIIILLILALTVELSNPETVNYDFLYGFKYTLFPLVLFLILRRVPWSSWFIRTGEAVLLGVGGFVALYGIVSFFLPQSFFSLLGYSDLHSLYVPGGPVAAFQNIESLGLRRIQSTLSGPNQLGMWLLLPWSIGLLKVLSKSKEDRRKFSVFSFQFSVTTLALVFIALVLTFSRAAWIAAFVIALLAARNRCSKKTFQNCAVRLGAIVIGLVLLGMFLKPEIFLRTISLKHHVERPLEAVQTIIENPIGLGLGSAGPASNRTSDACVFLEEGSDASWAEPHKDLCVFVGETQVQPTIRNCSCPRLPENWYLQVGIEIGILGFILFVTLILQLIYKLQATSYKLAFVGISIAALFLHSWESAAVAYTVWILLGSNSTVET